MFSVLKCYSLLQLYRTLCIDIYTKKEKYIKIFECSIYTKHFAYTILTTLKWIYLQYILYMLGFPHVHFPAECSVHFHPCVKKLVLWIHSTFFKMKPLPPKKLKHWSAHRKWSILFWEDRWLINQKSKANLFSCSIWS